MVLSAGKTWTSTQANYKRTSIDTQQLSDDDHTQPNESEVGLTRSHNRPNQTQSDKALFEPQSNTTSLRRLRHLDPQSSL